MPDETTYTVHDQAEKLGPAPWKPTDPAVVAWEKAHGHDPRLHCYLDGCGVLQERAEAEHAELEALKAEVVRLPVRLVYAPGGREIGLFVSEALLELGDYPVIAASVRAAILREPQE